MASAEPLDDAAERPAAFDLRDAWQSITADFVEATPRFEVTANVDAWVLPILRGEFGAHLATVSSPDTSGRHRVEVHAATLAAAVGILAGLGDAVEVVAPDDARRHLADLGAKLTARYAEPTGTNGR